jgi:hypothetical protein
MLRRRLIVPAVAACLMAPSLWAAETAATGEGTFALWTDKELTFVYLGFTTKYSCDGLRDKMRDVLLNLGADKKSLKVNELGCTSATGRPDPFPGVRAKMRVLQPGWDDKQNPVAAHWQPVDLKLNSFVIDSGECELMEQIRQKVLPLFAVRNVQFYDNCIPHQASATRPTLKLEVLRPDAQHPEAAPPAGQ